MPTYEIGGKGCFGVRKKGNYLIIDAATGAEIEAKTYVHCNADRE
jgi:hypothetical protein